MDTNQGGGMASPMAYGNSNTTNNEATQASTTTSNSWSQLAEERRQNLKDTLKKTTKHPAVAKGLQSAKKIASNLNVGHWIDALERDQGTADHLESINQDLQQEADSKQLVAQAKEDCLIHIRRHLGAFLHEHPNGRYEDWITELHPDNVVDGKVDARFYVSESDHRLLWNEVYGSLDIPAASRSEE